MSICESETMHEKNFNKIKAEKKKPRKAVCKVDKLNKWHAIN